MFKNGQRCQITGECSGPFEQYNNNIVTIKGPVVGTYYPHTGEIAEGWFYVKENKHAWCISELTLLPENQQSLWYRFKKKLGFN